MKRVVSLIGAALTCLVLLSTVTIAAQQQPPPTLPPIPSPTFDPTFAVTAEPTLDPAVQTAVPVDPASPAAPLPTADPNAGASALSPAAAEALPLILRARADLELLADQAFGVGVRPDGWNGSMDSNDAQFPLLVRFDLEVMAGNLLGADLRPAGWFGSVVSVPLAFARDIRHDLELLADQVVGAPTIRPAGWQGDDPYMRCDRATQALVTLLGRQGISISVDTTVVGYCDTLTLDAARYVEREILQPIDTNPVDASTDVFNANQPFRIDSPFAIAFLDRNARQRAGVIPEGTGFTAIARSGVGFSNMMLIEGQAFRVFVDYTTTPVTTTQFESLPDVATLGEATTCNAEWCD